ncbi:hypothetical protein ACH4VM_02730 [Streptomyces sp. NPDC020792]|uniref:hypothetical protein n=1 Tax=Streptomyces sp. NPDC020792 TaxID=3365089 RepID=UPI0037B0274C
MTTETTEHALPRRTESGMATRSVNAAAGVILAAMQNGRQTPTGIAIALDSARLLQSPETAAEHAQLRAMYNAVSEREHDLIGERDELRAERDKALAQRNAVVATNERLHAQVEEAGRARIQAENEARVLTHRIAKLEARLAEDDRPAGEDPIAYTLTPAAENLRAKDDVTPQVRRLRALLAGQREETGADQ